MENIHGTDMYHPTFQVGRGRSEAEIIIHGIWITTFPPQRLGKSTKAAQILVRALATSESQLGASVDGSSCDGKKGLGKTKTVTD